MGGLLARGTRTLAEAYNLVGYKNAQQDYRQTDKHRRLVMERYSFLLRARKLTDGRTHRHTDTQTDRSDSIPSTADVEGNKSKIQEDLN